jgi:tetratricopeptide (TPR) repeat protein
MQAEEGMGQAEMGLEDYPQALAHFRAALSEAKTAKLDNYIPWPIIESAEALWSSGHLDAAAEELDFVPATQWAQASATSRVALDRAHIQLARGQFRQSLATIEQTLAKDPSGGGVKTDLLILKVQCFLHAGESRSALSLADEILAAENTESSPVDVAQGRLAKAQALVAIGSHDAATALATEAARVFETAGAQESETLSLWTLAQAAKLSGNLQAASDAASKALDIMAGLEHNWGISEYRSYTARRDIAEMVQGLSVLRRK